jgi:tetratricopeptide (TPR) repeat protein/membrane protease YdiL (CAAX protease family)
VIRGSPLFYFFIVCASLTAVAQKSPDHTAVEPAPDKEHFRTGCSLEDQQRYEEAVREFQTAIAINPRDSRFYDNLGFCLRKLQKLDAAAKALNTAMSINPRDSYAYRELAAIYCDRRDFPHAIELLNECISLNSSDVNARFWLGYALHRNKNDLAAVTAFDEALKLHPEDFDANYWRGLSLLRLNRVQEADESLAKAVEIRPKDFNANLWRGMCLIRRHDFKNAAASFEKAHEIRPADKMARFELFACSLASGQTEKASQAYPHLLIAIGGSLVFVYAVWFAALLPFSLPVRDKSSPGLWFSLAWLGLFIEGQAAFVMLLASLPSRWHEAVLSGAILSALPIIIVALIGFARQPWGAPFRSPPRLGSPKFILTCVLCIFGTLLIANGLAVVYHYATNNPFPMQRTIPLIRAALQINPVVSWLAVVFVIPFVEEILFRGLLFAAFEKFWGTTGAIFASSALFVVFHLQVIGFLILFLLGLTLAWARLRTASLGLPIVLHALNNAIAMLILTFVPSPLTN